MMLYCRLLGAVLLVCTGFAAGQAYCQRLWAQWRAVCGFERLLTYLADQLAFCALPSAELLAAAAEHPAFAAYCPPNAASFAELRLPLPLAKTCGAELHAGLHTIALCSRQQAPQTMRTLAALCHRTAQGQYAAAQQGQRQIMRCKRFSAQTQPGTKCPCRREAARRRGHVNHRSTREVHSAHLGHPAAAPHPVGHGAIHEKQPQYGKKQHCREVDTLGIRTGYERQRQYGKHALEEHKKQWRNAAGGSGTLHVHAAQQNMRKTAYDPAEVWTKSKRIPHNEPQCPS